MIGGASCDRSERTNRPVTRLGPISSAFSRLSVTQSHSSGADNGVRAPLRCGRRGSVVSSMITRGRATDRTCFDPRATGHRYWQWSHERYSSSESSPGTSLLRIALESHFGHVGCTGGGEPSRLVGLLMLCMRWNAGLRAQVPRQAKCARVAPISALRDHGGRL